MFHRVFTGFTSQHGVLLGRCTVRWTGRIFGLLHAWFDSRSFLVTVTRAYPFLVRLDVISYVVWMRAGANRITARGRLDSDESGHSPLHVGAKSVNHRSINQLYDSIGLTS